MDYILLQEFFATYSLPVLVIALVIGIIKVIADKYLAKKLPQFILAYSPFLLCMLLYNAYEMIFVLKSFEFSTQSVYAGLLSGSLSVVIASILRKIAGGKPLNVSQTVLLIEGLLHGFISDNLITKTAIEVEKVLLSNCAEEVISEQVKNTILMNANDTISNDQLLNLSHVIVKAFNMLNTNA